MSTEIEVELRLGKPLATQVALRILEGASEADQKRFARALFRRNELRDPLVALRAVVRQVAREHHLKLSDVLRYMK